MFIENNPIIIMDTEWTIALSVLSVVIVISMVSLCLFCKRKTPKSELMGIEGNVKLRCDDEYTTIVGIDEKTLDDHQLNQVSKIPAKNATLPADVRLNGPDLVNELKRSTNAPHRSLPDIPSAPNDVCDNNSELYATVGDKVQEEPQGTNPSTIQKMSNISQHSSISQADDASSPYARVRSPPHAYDKLKREHPYAQVKQPGTKGSIAQVVEDDDDDEDDNEEPSVIEDPISHRESSQNLLGSENIPAASAIAGRISASQDLPYMTPPIVQPAMQQHFSGDSQDSSKGYTSISVREPLANIRAQTNQQNVERRRRDREINDSHYATVSDDSDEMYAAIEDPNNPGELYTSGSETYAQIQPQPLTVSVEINQPSGNSTNAANNNSTNRYSNRFSSASSHIHTIEEVHDTLKVNVHSRQASSSSCTSSVGNIGSPKIEKRMGPLPPTPNQMRNSNSSMDQHDGRLKDTNNNNSKANQNASKDLEGMYAKVMKKSKLSNLPSEGSSPVMSRKAKEQNATGTGNDVTDCPDANKFISPNKQLPKIPNDYETIEKKASGNKDDAGYEIIPADRNNNGIKDNEVGLVDLQVKIPDYAQITEKPARTSKAKMSLFQGYESIHDTSDKSLNDPNYETLKNPLKLTSGASTTDSDYDPNYEVVIPNTNLSSSSSTTLVDDGYSQIMKKTSKTKDLNDGYSSIRTLKNQIEDEDDDDIPGYSTIKEPNENNNVNNNLPNSIKVYDDDLINTHHYSSIPAISASASGSGSHLSAENRKTPISETRTTPSTDSNSSDALIDYENITRTSTSNSVVTPTNVQNEKSSTNSNYESLSNSESNTEDPNYESMKYLNVNKEENPYERLHNEKCSPDGKDETAVKRRSQEGNKSSGNPEVDDYFQV